MATGTGNLPYPGKVYVPFDILTAQELNEDVANIESLADGTGIGDGALNGSVVLQDNSVGADKLDWSNIALNAKTGTNSSTLSPTTGDNNFASSGASVSFTVASNCAVLLIATVTLVAVGDSEMQVLVYNGSTKIKTGVSPAQILTSGRGASRTISFTTSISAGTHTFSSGVWVSGSSGYSIGIGGTTISAMVLGNVTA